MADTVQDMTSSLMRRVSAWSRYVPQTTGIASIALGISVLVGWQFGIEVLKRIMPQFVAMNPASAIGLVISGLCLVLLAGGSRFSSIRVRAARMLGLMVAGLGMIKVIMYLGGPDLGIDRLLFSSQLADGESQTNALSPNSAVSLVLLGLALFAARAERKWLRQSASVLALITSFASMVAAIGYFNGVTSLYRPTEAIPVALHSLLGFLMISLGIVTLELKEEKLSLEKKVTVGFSAALYLLAVIGTVSYASLQNSSTASGLNEHSLRVTASILEITGLTVDAETGARGYVISGDESFLEPFQKAQNLIPAQVATLRTLTGDNPAQQKQLNVLEPLVDQHTAALKRLIEVRRGQGALAAEQLVAGGQTKAMMDRIRESLATMRTIEDGLLHIRSQETVRSNHVTTMVISAGSVLAIAVVVLAGLAIKRDVSKRREAQEMLDNFFTLSLDMICVADTHGHFTKINPAWTQVLGFTQEEILSRPYYDLIHPDDIKATESEAQKVAGGQEIQSFENRYRCKDGSYRWLTWKSVLGPDKTMIFATARDVTDRKRIEEEMRIARAQAEESNESKSRFLANMSHEIRTPMSAIIGYADLLMDERQNQSDRLEHINTIRRNGEHLLAIINDVLDLSKIEADKFQIERLGCCPCQILSDVASLMRVRAVEKLIRLEVKNEGVVPAMVMTDPARLRQILINLVGNAVKFTDEGWVKLIMRLEERPTGGPMLRFDVMDTGIGMTREQIGQLFQPFVQADGSTTRRFGGTGLGLTISKRLAEMLGGTIEVDSSPGRGSTFTLRVDPGSLEGVARLKNCREALEGASLNHPRDRAAIGLTSRILLVDDGHDNRKLLSVYLREAGATVELAENGRIGSDLVLAAEANGEPFDVVLMDMQMPELDGYGATAKLRSKGYRGTVIALTAHAMAEDREKCLRAGCTDYLSKPVRRQGPSNDGGEVLPGSSENLTEGALDPLPNEKVSLEPSIPHSGRDSIQSSLTDEDLRTYLAEYVKELPARVADLEACVTRADLQELSTKVHNLRGTGGLYGLMPITEAAERVEHLIRGQAQLDAIKSEVAQLIQTLRNVEGFSQPTPAGEQSDLAH